MVMNGRSLAILAVVLTCFVSSVQAAISLGGSRDDEIISLIYDPRNGQLDLEGAGKKLTAIEILSPGAYLTGPRPDWDSSCFLIDCYRGPQKIFLLKPGNAAFSELDFGPLVTPGLSAETLANDLDVSGAIFPSGGLGTVDLIYVPEPSSMIPASMFALCLARRTRDRRGTFRTATK